MDSKTSIDIKLEEILKDIKPVVETATIVTGDYKKSPDYKEKRPYELSSAPSYIDIVE